MGTLFEERQRHEPNVSEDCASFQGSPGMVAPGEVIPSGGSGATGDGGPT